MAQVAPINVESVKIESVSARSFAAPQTINRVRVASNGYLSLLFSLTFAAGFLYHLEYEVASVILFVSTWFFVPFAAWFDRYEFDGETLSRKGLIAFSRNRIQHQFYNLGVSEIESVETDLLRNIKIGGRIFCRHRTEICGGNRVFIINSNGGKNQRFLRNVLEAIDDEKLDLRSRDLRDFSIEPDELRLKIAALQLPSTEFLESTSPKFRSTIRREVRESYAIASEINDNWRVKSNGLRQIANELRVAGKLAQSVEAFRRALLWQPNDANLICDFARCLLAYASFNQNEKAERRANAALRLAKIRGKYDAGLLTRIGEIYFQFDESDFAKDCFKSALTLQINNFRAERGLAEIALQTGKLAHVVHHFRAASRSGETSETRSWANAEAAYFSNLNGNDDYLTKELSRITSVNTLLRIKKNCRNIMIFGLLMLFGGLIFDKIVAEIGWVFAGATMLIDSILVVTERFFCERVKFFD